MHIQNLFTSFNIRTTHSNFTVKTTRSQNGSVQDVYAVGCGHNDDSFIYTESIHFNQQLIQGLFPLIVPASEGCRNLIDEIISTNAVFPELSLKCSGLFLALLNEISEVNRRCKGDRESLDSPHVMRAKQYIYRNIHKPIRQKEIAEHLGITSEYLCAVFKKCEGCSVMSYINRTKLKGVYDLMEKEGLSLSRAASQYGYSDSNYVSRLYKKHFSVNISESVEQSRNAGLIVYQT